MAAKNLNKNQSSSSVKEVFILWITAGLDADKKTGQPITTCEWIDRLVPKAWAVMTLTAERFTLCAATRRLRLTKNLFGENANAN